MGPYPMFSMTHIDNPYPLTFYGEEQIEEMEDIQNYNDERVEIE